MKKFLLLHIFFFQLTIYLTAQMSSDSLVAYYPFNGNVKDSTAFSNHGIIQGAEFVKDRFGNSNNAISFNGYNDYVEIPYSTSLMVGSSRTVTFWMYPYTWDGTAGILCQDGSHGNQIFAEYDNRFRWEMFANSSPTNINSDEDFIKKAEWQFISIVMTTNGTETTVMFYRNGISYSQEMKTTVVDKKTTNYFIG